MADRGTVISQQWTPEEVRAYCIQKFESKRPAYLRKAEERVGNRFSSRGKRTVNSNGNLSKAEYMRFMEKGLSDEHILAKYQDLTLERLEMAKKRWGFA